MKDPDDGFLYFLGREGGRRINSEHFLFSQVNPDTFPANDPVDTLFILDCCYSHVACRAAQISPRIVEVIAATDESSPLAFSPLRNTVTAKFAGEIRHRQRNGDRYVEFADVVETLRARPDAVKRPSHRLKLGAVSIVLPFSGLRTVDPSRCETSLKAVFSVHIADVMTAAQLPRFVDWIRSLPGYASTTVDAVYHTSSTLVVLGARYSVYSKLAGMEAYTLICEAKEKNLMPQLLRPATSGSSDAAKKENIPFGHSGGKQGL
ncbi:hypothetical protein BJX99DRAFT_254245 [Aspergillus californicus]